ncbi:PAAR domain-containing protein [Pandoraea communis]|uniref:PAAR domain-containing protein n=1 Tax=Pandoraea communis TaxID=2508297 RepID=UPI0025A6552B|nr:PAAR domain-containing protein [Pandoraea communis]MDM8359318.1 PAAR domain-containing protein [Pandoraea communis]
MSSLIFEGDTTSHGGKVLSGSGHIKINGRRSARKGDPISCPKHGRNEIVEGSDRIKDRGVPAALAGLRGRCGCILIASTDRAKVI